MKRALVLINPKSRSGGKDLAPALSRLRAAGWDLLVESPVRTALAKRISTLCPRVQRIVVAGGDGTLNAAAPALLACGRPVGLLPMGTANDLARTLRIPFDLSAAGEIVATGRPHRVDLGCVNDVLFFNAAHIGLGAELTHRLSPETKKRLGTLAYPRALLAAYRSRRSFSARISCDNEHLRLRSLQITVGNGRYYGGGTPVAAQARIDDQQLFLYSIAPRRSWKLAALLPRLKRGTHEGAPQVLVLHGRDITVEPATPMPISTDGEIRTRTPAHFTVLPRALEFIVPEDFHPHVAH